VCGLSCLSSIHLVLGHLRVHRPRSHQPIEHRLLLRQNLIKTGVGARAIVIQYLELASADGRSPASFALCGD